MYNLIQFARDGLGIPEPFNIIFTMIVCVLVIVGLVYTMHLNVPHWIGTGPNPRRVTPEQAMRRFSERRMEPVERLLCKDDPGSPYPWFKTFPEDARSMVPTADGLVKAPEPHAADDLEWRANEPPLEKQTITAGAIKADTHTFAPEPPPEQPDWDVLGRPVNQAARDFENRESHEAWSMRDRSRRAAIKKWEQEFAEKIGHVPGDQVFLKGQTVPMTLRSKHVSYEDTADHTTAYVSYVVMWFGTDGQLQEHTLPAHLFQTPVEH